LDFTRRMLQTVCNVTIHANHAQIVPIINVVHVHHQQLIFAMINPGVLELVHAKVVTSMMVAIKFAHYATIHVTRVQL
jgi:hypothetical protein